LVENLFDDAEQHMFGKSDLIDSLSRDLGRTRDRRDALASEVTTLTAEIAVLESRISAENDRRERERAASEIEGVKNRVKSQYLALVPVITGMRDATQAAAALTSDARELDDVLMVIATEIGNAIDRVLGDLDGRIEILRAGQASSHGDCFALSQDNDRILRLPEWLPHKKPTKDAGEDQCSTVAA
jgi:chromosome segregation ATPase